MPGAARSIPHMPPAARQNDPVVGVDTHIVNVPSPGGPVPTPMPNPFQGALTGELSTDVMIGHLPAAVKGSKATNAPPHIPVGGPFQTPPKNEGTVSAGSSKVQINDKPAARMGDSVKTCNDPQDSDTSTIVAGEPTVMIG